MGKYSNVNTSSLRNEANNALNELNSYNISNLGELADCTFKGKANIRFALNSIQNGGLNGGILLLKQKLNNLVSACDKIDTYKGYEGKVQELKDDENNGTWEDSGKKDLLGKVIYYFKRNVHTSDIEFYNNKISKLEIEIDSLLS